MSAYHCSDVRAASSRVSVAVCAKMEEVKVNFLSFKLSDRYGDSQVFKGKYQMSPLTVVDVAIKRLLKDNYDDQLNPRNKASYVLDCWSHNGYPHVPENIVRILHHEHDAQF